MGVAKATPKGQNHFFKKKKLLNPHWTVGGGRRPKGQTHFLKKKLQILFGPWGPGGRTTPKGY
jgi:hypothetical protein